MHTCCTQCLYFQMLCVLDADDLPRCCLQITQALRAVLVLPAPALQLMSVTTTAKCVAFHAVGAAAPALRAWWIQVVEVVLVGVFPLD